MTQKYNWARGHHRCCTGTGCILKGSEAVGIICAIAMACKSTLQSMGSRAYIALPCTAPTNTTERCNMRASNCGSLVVLVRLTVHKKHGQIEYDESFFSFRPSKRAPKV